MERMPATILFALIVLYLFHMHEGPYIAEQWQEIDIPQWFGRFLFFRKTLRQQYPLRQIVLLVTLQVLIVLLALSHLTKIIFRCSVSLFPISALCFSIYVAMNLFVIGIHYINSNLSSYRNQIQSFMRKVSGFIIFLLGIIVIIYTVQRFF